MTSFKKRKGLTKKHAKELLNKVGLNELRKKPQLQAFKIFFRQLTNFIIWILVAASAISYGIGEEINFWVINFIIIFIIVLGFIQEYKAERAVEALKEMVRPSASVIRDGKLTKIASNLIVPGDLLVLETGDRISADAKIIEETALRLDESTLTGESNPVSKQKNEDVYAGTQVVNGRCIALVSKTGMRTKLGSIAEMIQQKEEPTPLQIRFDRLGKMLALIALIACMTILVVGVIKGASPLAMLVVALALAVAAVPEGLPLTMTLALSFGMHKMAKKKAVVRRMMAVETLGSTTMICSDKTGTLTKNEMTVQHLYINGQTIDVTGAGYKPVGKFNFNKKPFKLTNGVNELLKSALLCNNAELNPSGNRWHPIGDPTELALVTVAMKAGFDKEKLEKQNRRVEEILFTSSRKMMSTIHKADKGHMICTKGAPEEILKHCTYQMVAGKRKKLTAKDRKELLKTNDHFARQALRVLAIAHKSTTSKSVPSKNVEAGLTFLGLVAMKDPARPEVKKAIATCQRAGMEVMMITGDQEQTAISIAKQIGMDTDAKVPAMTGAAIDEVTDKQLSALLKTVRIFARTRPEHKLRIVNLLKKQGHIVAMTGDGVNDAPALKKADIGIAMGIKGTDVTKEASEMILQDDNFATIVTAVEEGRRIYSNIEKFTGYILSRNFTEVILIFLGIIFFDFELLPLLALQILFINMIGEEMPAIALGLDESHHNIMNEPPRNPNEPLLNRYNSFIIFSVATFMALVAFILFITQNPVANIEKARTMVFAAIVWMVIFNTYNFRSLRSSSLNIKFFNNRLLNFSIVFVILLTAVVMYYPPVRGLFSMTELTAKDWAIAIPAAFSTFIYMEVVKAYHRRFGS